MKRVNADMLRAARAVFDQPEAALFFTPSAAVEKIIGGQKPVVVPAIDGPQGCAHDDTLLECPFCFSVHVDPDTRICAVCKCAVESKPVCAHCGEAVPHED